MREEKQGQDNMWIPWVGVINIITPHQLPHIDMGNIDPLCIIGQV
jgi:hypothetical protein